MMTRIECFFKCDMYVAHLSPFEKHSFPGLAQSEKMELKKKETIGRHIYDQDRGGLPKAPII